MIKLSRVISLLDQHTNHTLVHSGQNHDYELNQIFFEDLNIRKPDYFLDCAKETPSKTIGNLLVKIEDILDEINPDAFLILGDTNSCFGALVAKKKKIPIFHLEAGNRCFDIRVPEEINRKLIDHLSDVNITYTKLAKDYLIKEGMNPQNIIKVGSPMKEVLDYYEDDIKKSNILGSLGLTPESYYLLSSHREENIDTKNFKGFIEILNYLSERSKKCIVSTHPRTRKRLEKEKVSFNKNIIFNKPLAFTDYVKLMQNSKCVLSDSGTLTEEASILSLKSINLREVHERPEGDEKSVSIFTGMSLKRVESALEFIESKSFIPPQILEDYSNKHFSNHVLGLILSYTDKINTFSWIK